MTLSEGVTHVAICGLSSVGRYIGDHCQVQADDRKVAEQIAEIYADTLHFQGWKCVPHTDEVGLSEVTKKFVRNGEVRYVVLWQE
jgi:hypothetical protein